MSKSLLQHQPAVGYAESRYCPVISWAINTARYRREIRRLVTIVFERPINILLLLLLLLNVSLSITKEDRARVRYWNTHKTYLNHVKSSQKCPPDHLSHPDFRTWLRHGSIYVAQKALKLYDE